MKALLKSSDGFISEMSLIYEKAEKEPRWHFIHANMGNIQLLIYFLVVMLNLNILFSPALFFEKNMTTENVDLVDEWGVERNLKAKNKGKSNAGETDDGDLTSSNDFFLSPYESALFGFTGNLEGFGLNHKMRCVILETIHDYYPFSLLISVFSFEVSS